MPDNLSLQDLLEVQKHFDLPSPALVEKDWYVVKALAAINSADARPFRLVFGGGTALSRAHRLTRRMSEDVDLKIVSDQPRSRAELRKLRDTVTSALLNAGFQFDPENSEQRPRWTSENRPYVDTSKLANGAEPEQDYLYPARGHLGKHFVRLCLAGLY